MSRVIIVGITFVAAALSAFVASITRVDLKSLPTIKADHRMARNGKRRTYQIPSGKGFVIDTTDYKKEIEQAASASDFFDGVSFSIRSDLDQTMPVTLEPGQNLYGICPDGGIKPGDEFSVEMVEETNSSFMYNCARVWTANVSVK